MAAGLLLLETYCMLLLGLRETANGKSNRSMKYTSFLACQSIHPHCAPRQLGSQCLLFVPAYGRSNLCVRSMEKVLSQLKSARTTGKQKKPDRRWCLYWAPIQNFRSERLASVTLFSPSHQQERVSIPFLSPPAGLFEQIDVRYSMLFLWERGAECRPRTGQLAVRRPGQRLAQHFLRAARSA